MSRRLPLLPLLSLALVALALAPLLASAQADFDDPSSEDFEIIKQALLSSFNPSAANANAASPTSRQLDTTQAVLTKVTQQIAATKEDIHALNVELDTMLTESSQFKEWSRQMTMDVTRLEKVAERMHNEVREFHDAHVAVVGLVRDAETYVEDIAGKSNPYFWKFLVVAELAVVVVIVWVVELRKNGGRGKHV